MKKRQFYGSIDIGGTKVRIGILDINGRVIARNMFLTPLKKSWQEFMKLIFKRFDEILADSEMYFDDILGIAVGCPGTIDIERDTVGYAPNLNWREIPIREELSSLFPVPVFLENDTNLSTLGVAHFGEGRRVSNMIGIFIGTGIGGGIIIDGKLFIGSTGGAGEVGHMILGHTGHGKSRGNASTLESIASTKSIYNAVVNAYEEKYSSTDAIYEQFISNANKSLAIKFAYDSEEPIAVKIIEEAIYALGIAIVNLIDLFNPSLVVLGGGLAETLGDVIVQKTMKAVREQAMPGTFEKVKIVRTSLGDDAPLLGGAALLKQKLK